MLTTAGFEPATRADINLGGVSTKKRNRREAQDIKPMMDSRDFLRGGRKWRRGREQLLNGPPFVVTCRFVARVL